MKEKCHPSQITEPTVQFLGLSQYSFSSINVFGVFSVLGKELVIRPQKQSVSRWQEPVTKDDPLLSISDHPRVIFSPHNAWGSKSAQETLWQILSKQVTDFIDNHR